MNNNNFRKIMLLNENNLSKFATYDKDAIRFGKISSDFRPNYYRDIDRIIHSLSYTRYIDKTQVFSESNNDNISKRIIHVSLVSKIARTIGRALQLNEDLIEAIALGHDIGHIPFGHEGEYILNEISLKHNEGYFNHNAQSVRTLMYLEENGEGKNLTLQTLDGILCHNGELPNQYYISKKKSKKDFMNDYNNTFKYENYSCLLTPMTLEGCVVRISDIIAYIGRDIEDAIRLDRIKKEEIPKSITDVIGTNNREMVNTIILDIINNSYGKNHIEISDKIYKAIVDLKDFNYKHIYSVANTKEEKVLYKEAFNKLFDYYLQNINNIDCSINEIYLKNMNTKYLNSTSDARKVIDYIAGMTDDYFMNEYHELIKKNETHC